MAADPRGDGGAGPAGVDAALEAPARHLAAEPDPAEEGVRVGHYIIRTLGYGWEVRWAFRDDEVLFTTVIEEEPGIQYCCRCRRSVCAHARAVRELVRRSA